MTAEWLLTACWLIADWLLEDLSQKDEDWELQISLDQTNGWTNIVTPWAPVGAKKFSQERQKVWSKPGCGSPWHSCYFAEICPKKANLASTVKFLPLYSYIKTARALLSLRLLINGHKKPWHISHVFERLAVWSIRAVFDELWWNQSTTPFSHREVYSEQQAWLALVSSSNKPGMTF